MNELRTESKPSRLARAYYIARFEEFRSHSDDTVLAALARGTSFAIELSQRDAWQSQISIMRGALREFAGDGLIAFEFAVPRMGKRVDILLVPGEYRKSPSQTTHAQSGCA